MKTTDFIVVGVGGQGTILASDVLAQVGLDAGLDAKKSEVHGMSQRGGSVISHVRWGEKVYSPLIGKGEADFLLAFEKLEALRYADWLKPGGVALVNDQAIPPVAVSSGGAEYPTDAQFLAAFKKVTDRVYLVPGNGVANELGSARVNNVVLLGALSVFVDVDAAVWRAVIEGRVPAKYADLNQRAFERGRALVKG
jgi:indolepyruvate ferredoxin oxidoreductase beta subunit